MQHRSKGVFALSCALFGAASAAGCTNDRLDLFDPTSPLPPAKDAGPNPTPDAASIDAPSPLPDATADAQSPPEPDVAARDTGAPPNDDAAPEPKDAGVVPEDTGRGNDTDANVFDAPVFDVGIDRDVPPIDAGRPMDAGNPTGFDCSTVQGVVFHGHCYFTIAATEWNEGTCESHDAHLATLTTADEQTAAAAAGKGQERWIGLRRRNNSPHIPMSFMWVANEPLLYTNWHDYGGNNREPNYTGECARMLDDGTWADNNCTDRFPTLCEHE